MTQILQPICEWVGDSNIIKVMLLMKVVFSKRLHCESGLKTTNLYTTSITYFFKDLQVPIAEISIHCSVHMLVGI